MDPTTIDKYLYVRQTPTWKVRSLYVFGILSWLCILWGFRGAIALDPFYQWFVVPVLGILTIYHLASFALNLFYTQFDLDAHFRRVQAFWKIRVVQTTKEVVFWRPPSVDIFLPICGEDIDILVNTWTHVARLKYRNKRVYVLDDSATYCAEHQALAKQFGFTYIERPNKGEMKKAGNLKYAYERTCGEYIVIFDADFAPHPDFLTETLPYMSDPTVGIVQTPQYFATTADAYRRSPLAYNAAFAEEPFYRFIQVTRSRFGGTVCCGSNAVYRRSALEKIGGPVQIDYSEDAHTGFMLTSAGYRVLFVPILLAVGLCPDNYYSFFHQQHRWGMGSMRLMLSKKFWRAPISWQIKFCYITGFMFYLHHPIVIIFSFQLFWTLFFYNEYIPFGHNVFFYPHLAFAITYVWLFPIAKLRPGYFNVLIARTYAYTHAVKTALLGKSVGWISTNAKHSSVSPAFRQTTRAVTAYVMLYLLLVLVALRTGDLHLFDYRYWSVQFWIFWNLLLSTILFVQFQKTIRSMRR
jgi:cellulose synthase/poly-beta-1,6-N-acetylglucosamine synthase-like glycosyltransferase